MSINTDMDTVEDADWSFDSFNGDFPNIYFQCIEIYFLTKYRQYLSQTCFSRDINYNIFIMCWFMLNNPNFKYKKITYIWTNLKKKRNKCIITHIFYEINICQIPSVILDQRIEYKMHDDYYAHPPLLLRNPTSAYDITLFIDNLLNAEIISSDDKFYKYKKTYPKIMCLFLGNIASRNLMHVLPEDVVRYIAMFF